MSLCPGLFSLNVRGLRDSKKRRELFRWLKHFLDGAKSIIFLQETHSVDQDVLVWEKEWCAKIVMSHGKTNIKAEAVLFPPKNYFNIDSIDADPMEGEFH